MKPILKRASLLGLTYLESSLLKDEHQKQYIMRLVGKEELLSIIELAVRDMTIYSNTILSPEEINEIESFELISRTRDWLLKKDLNFLG